MGRHGLAISSRFRSGMVQKKSPARGSKRGFSEPIAGQMVYRLASITDSFRSRSIGPPGRGPNRQA